MVSLHDLVLVKKEVVEESPRNKELQNKVLQVSYIDNEGVCSLRDPYDNGRCMPFVFKTDDLVVHEE